MDRLKSTRSKIKSMEKQVIEKLEEVTVSIKVTKSTDTPNNYERLCVLGTGAFGKVYQVRKRQDGQIYALKVVLNPPEATDKRHLRHEEYALKTVKSAFVCEMFESFKSEQKTYFLLEFLSGGELFTLLNRETKLYEEESWFYLAETTVALEHIHDQNIIFRDLKTQNIMLDREGHVKLTDFGLCKKLAKGSTTRTFCGTLESMPPEVIRHEEYGHAVDLWALGVFNYDMIVGGSPFAGQTPEETKKSILSGRYWKPDMMSKEGLALVRGLLQVNPVKRWTISDIKNSKFFKGVNWEQVAARGYDPPFKPDLRNQHDISQFETQFTTMPVENSPFKAVRPKNDENDPFKEFDYNGPSTNKAGNGSDGKPKKRSGRKIFHPKLFQ